MDSGARWSVALLAALLALPCHIASQSTRGFIGSCSPNPCGHGGVCAAVDDPPFCASKVVVKPIDEVPQKIPRPLVPSLARLPLISAIRVLRMVDPRQLASARIALARGVACAGMPPPPVDTSVDLDTYNQHQFVLAGHTAACVACLSHGRLWAQGLYTRRIVDARRAPVH